MGRIFAFIWDVLGEDTIESVGPFLASVLIFGMMTFMLIRIIWNLPPPASQLPLPPQYENSEQYNN